MLEPDPIMPLSQWAATDSQTREQIETECFQQGVPRRIGRVAEEAANILVKELAQIPQVTGVCVGQTQSPRRVFLMVSTSLSGNERLPGIPDEFAGFPVRQVGLAERKRDYLRRVEFVLRAAVVPAAEADSLLAWFAEDLSNINTPRYCETPARWIAQTLAGAVVKGNLVGDPLVKLSSSSRKSKLV